MPGIHYPECLENSNFEISNISYNIGSLLLHILNNDMQEPKFGTKTNKQ